MYIWRWGAGPGTKDVLGLVVGSVSSQPYPAGLCNSRNLTFSPALTWLLLANVLYPTHNSKASL